MSKRDRSAAPMIRVTAEAKARLDEIRKAMRRPIGYGQLIEDLTRNRLLELTNREDPPDWASPDRSK